VILDILLVLADADAPLTLKQIKEYLPTTVKVDHGKLSRMVSVGLLTVKQETQQPQHTVNKYILAEAGRVWVRVSREEC
jgi:hypothetical protein